MTSYGMWICEALADLNCSRAELAKISGIPNGTLGCIVSGAIQTPSDDVWEAIRFAVSGMKLGKLPYRRLKKHKVDTLDSGEEARYAVLAIMPEKGWVVYGIYPDRADAEAVAGSLLPLSGGPSIDAFVFRETSF